MRRTASSVSSTSVTGQKRNNNICVETWNLWMVQAWSQLGDKLRMPYRSGYEEDGFLRLLNISHRSEKNCLSFYIIAIIIVFFSLK
jgi:hypothetical protein